MFYTKKTIEDRIHIMQKNRKIVLIKLLYDKSSFEVNEKKIPFNKKYYEAKAEKYI